MLSTAIENFDYIELHPQDFDRYIPTFAPDTDNLKQEASDYLKACNENLNFLHTHHYHSEHILGVRTLMVDRLISFLFHHFDSEICLKYHYNGPKACVVAHGGYGRGEMNILSDIDLLFIYSKKKGPYIEGVSEKILYLLWDLKADIGFATRTIPECGRMFLEDVTIMTSLLDARYICGEKGLYEDLNEVIGRILSSDKVKKKCVRQKMEERDERIKKYGDSVYVCEPNVKECAGGLRDLQTPLWIAKMLGIGSSYQDLVDQNYLSQEDCKTLLQARNFIWRIRNEIHFLMAKKTDLLNFEMQEKISERLGYQDQEAFLAVEQFMQAYYQNAHKISAITDTLLRQMCEERSVFKTVLKKIRTLSLGDYFKVFDGQILVRNQQVFQKHPISLMQIFKYVQTKKLTIHPMTKDYIRMSLDVVDDDFRSDPANVEIFRSMLNQYERLGKVLHAMHEVQFLEAWMPEFKRLRCRVQHDIYHIYTIDTHSIFAVEELSKLDADAYKGKFDFFKEVMDQVKRPELLSLGIFLHDVGKGYGSNHSVRGAEIASHITKRFGYSVEEQKVIDFLIQSHLMMPHLSQRRDLNDPELIIRFAQSMENIDNLNMLFLLTWGDIRAVGPDAWTDWKGSLLTDLYQKGRQALETSDFSKEKAYQLVRDKMLELLNQISAEYKPKLSAFLDNLPPRYFFSHSVEDIKRHYSYCQGYDKDDAVVEFTNNEAESYTEIFIYSFSSPQIFSKVTGVLLSYSINIKGADIFQCKDSHHVITLRVSNTAGDVLERGNLLKDVRKTLSQALKGQISVEELLNKKQIPSYLLKKTVQKAKDRVEIDNDISAYYTVIDVYTYDRLGLLYDIIRTLGDQGLYVDVSRLSNKVEQVSDTFYVKDIFGMKVTSREKIRQAKKALLEVVSQTQA